MGRRGDGELVFDADRIAFPSGSVVMNPPAGAERVGWIPGSRRAHGGGNGNPLQCSCLENPVDRGAWPATVHGVAKSWTRLSTRACRWTFSCEGDKVLEMMV